MAADAIVEFKDASFSYDGTREAFGHVSLSIEQGSHVCIVGANGSGKSTLAKHVNALLVPCEGVVETFGLDTAEAGNAAPIRSRAALVMQNPDDQIVASIIEDEVAFGPENLGVSPAEINERIDAALAAVGLDSARTRETNALSGGQKQRLAIAGALAMKPRVVVLDEASSMLDPRGRADLSRVVKAMRAEGITVISITHFMEEAAQADRVVVMHEGGVALDGDPHDVLACANDLDSLGLEPPVAARIADALQDEGLRLPPCLTLDELEGALVAAARENDAASDLRAHVRDEGDPRRVEEGSAERAQSEEKADGAHAGASPLPVENDVEDAVITFDHVGFSYDADAQRARDKKRRRRARAHAGEGGRGESERGRSHPALSDVSFSLERGELLGVAGHTGSGKSTLIRHMNGLAQPGCGTVRVFGEDLADKRAASRARNRVGVVFQYPEQQLFAATVREDVAFGPTNLGLDPEEVDERVEHALSRVGLDPRSIGERSPFELSGGQKRRVAFAGVLAVEPEILVLDEPCAGLDPATRREFLDLTRSLHEDGLTIVMVSHAMDDLAELADRVLVLDEGRVVGLDEPRSVFAHAETLASIGLEAPSACLLAERLVKRGFDVQAKLYDERTVAEAIARAMRLRGVTGSRTEAPRAR